MTTFNEQEKEVKDLIPESNKELLEAFTRFVDTAKSDIELADDQGHERGYEDGYNENSNSCEQ